jgi:putative transposase
LKVDSTTKQRKDAEMDRNNKEAERQASSLIDRNGMMAQLLKECLQSALQEKFDEFMGAGPYERTTGRNGYRNGYYERQLHTRVGSITLAVCRDRDGKFEQDIFERYQRSEKALVLSVAEMYVSGVATRKVSNILETLCGSTISKSKVSELTKKLDENLHTWRIRSLGNKRYKYLVVDARYEKIREGGHIVSKAVIVIIGIDEEGTREILACYVMNSESEQAWNHCFQDLKDRGLHGVEYVVSDDNKGLRNALAKHFQGVKLQRCQVHFMRNFLGKLSRSEQAAYIPLLQSVFAAENKDDAMKQLRKTTAALAEKKKHKVAEWLEAHIEETLVVLELPAAHRKKMKSTNMLERFNQELKRRSRSVRIFPNEDSCLRLLTALCQEQSESWQDKRYLDMNPHAQES